MASKSIGSLFAELSLKDLNFSSGLKKASEEASSFKQAGIAIGVGLGATTAVIAAFVAELTAAATFLAAGTLKTIAQVDALNDLSNQTGVAVGDMMLLQQAYKDGGRDAGMAGKDIGRMQKSIVQAASGKGIDPFADLGLSAKRLLDMDTAQQFQTIGAAIMAIQNPAERTAKAMAIFGKGGMGLTTVFPGLEGLAEILGNAPALAQKFGGAMGEANDTIGHIKGKADQFFIGFTSGVIGTILPLLHRIQMFDFSNLGVSLGTTIASAIESVSSGDIWGQMAVEAEKVAMEIGQAIETQLKNSFLFLPALLQTTAGDFSDSIQREFAKWTGGVGPEAKSITDRFSENLKNMRGESLFSKSIAEDQKLLDAISKKHANKVLRDAADAAAKYPSASGHGGQSTGIADAGGNLGDGEYDAMNVPPPPVIPEPSVPQGNQMAKAADSIRFQSPVNDYQRRGLGTGVDPVKETDIQKGIDLLQGIKEILGKAQLEGSVLRF